MRRIQLATALLLCFAASALAQPKGPRDVITGAKEQQAQREMQRAADKGAEQAPPGRPSAGQALPPGHPPTGEAATPAAQGQPGAAAPVARQPSPHAAAPAGQPAEPRPMSEARVDTTLPVGTIKVRVLDQLERPVSGQEVRIGIMSGDGSREAKTARSGADGYATFSGLPAGTNKAYRASILHEGAKYGANPFRLPPRGGYDVTIRRLPVTTDERNVVLYVGAASVELKDERIKVVQQARLLNLGRETYVFPQAGTLVRLPEGFIAFQAQESMTDQRLEQAPGEGLRVKGSLPPGEATLMWGFDLPIEGSEAQLITELPWLTFAFRVVSDAPDGLELEVDEMPAPRLHSDQGRNFLITSVQRKVGEEPFRRLVIRLRGIPGPGPERWIAAALALFAVAGGFVFARRSPGDSQQRDAAGDLEARRTELIERAARLRAEREDDAIGPQYYDEERARIEDELAELLFVQDRLAKQKH